MQVARTKFGWIHLKSGGKVRLLPKPEAPEAAGRAGELRKVAERLIDSAAANGHLITGFAVVVWDTEMYSLADYRSGEGMPGTVIPEFVKMALLADLADEWTLDVIERRLGLPSR